jgi:hypothetical protein
MENLMNTNPPATYDSQPAECEPRVTALARAIMELSPESTPGWVRAIGPALAPVADAMEALRKAPGAP